MPRKATKRIPPNVVAKIAEHKLRGLSVELCTTSRSTNRGAPPRVDEDGKPVKYAEDGWPTGYGMWEDPSIKAPVRYKVKVPQVDARPGSVAYAIHFGAKHDPAFPYDPYERDNQFLRITVDHLVPKYFWRVTSHTVDGQFKYVRNGSKVTRVEIIRNQSFTDWPTDHDNRRLSEVKHAYLPEWYYYPLKALAERVSFHWLHRRARHGENFPDDGPVERCLEFYTLRVMDAVVQELQSFHNQQDALLDPETLDKPLLYLVSPHRYLVREYTGPMGDLFPPGHTPEYCLKLMKFFKGIYDTKLSDPAYDWDAYHIKHLASQHRDGDERLNVCMSAISDGQLDLRRDTEYWKLEVKPWYYFYEKHGPTPSWFAEASHSPWLDDDDGDNRGSGDDDDDAAAAAAAAARQNPEPLSDCNEDGSVSSEDSAADDSAADDSSTDDSNIAARLLSREQRASIANVAFEEASDDDSEDADYDHEDANGSSEGWDEMYQQVIASWFSGDSDERPLKRHRLTPAYGDGQQVTAAGVRAGQSGAETMG